MTGLPWRGFAGKPLRSSHILGALVLSSIALGSVAQGVSAPVAAPANACDALRDDDLQRLSLAMVLDHALCRSPVVRQAMLSITQQRASVELANLAYRPQVNLGAQLNANRVAQTANTAALSGQNLVGAIGLSWVLFDFGLRDANLAQAQAQLSAALAGLTSTQLANTGDTLRLYIDALSAWLRRDSLRQSEQVAQQSDKVATAKYDAQIGALAEKLQAQTALAQTTLERVRADGAWEAARVALVIHMGYAVTQRVSMPALEQAMPFLEADAPLDNMLVYLRESHPRIKVLQLEAEASRKRNDAIVAESKGSVGINSNLQISRALGGAGSSSALDRNVSASVVANIPLFAGDVKNQQLIVNNAQIETKLSQIEATRRELETELLKQALTVQTEIETRLAARALLKSAQQSYDVALGRYRAGVGTIVDLLTAQAAVGAARFALDQSYIAQATARLRMTSASGRMPTIPKI
jgi:outer membrane protein